MQIKNYRGNPLLGTYSTWLLIDFRKASRHDVRKANLYHLRNAKTVCISIKNVQVANLEAKINYVYFAL